MMENEVGSGINAERTNGTNGQQHSSIRNLCTGLSSFTIKNYMDGFVFRPDLEEDLDLDETYVASMEDSYEDEFWEIEKDLSNENKPTNLYEPPKLPTETDNSPEDLTEDGLVKKILLRKGNGYKPEEGSKLLYEYVAFIDGRTEPFDSATGANMASVVLGPDCGLIFGLKIGLESMEILEEARFVIHYSYAYGKLGCQPRIPPEAAIIFNVRVQKFVDSEKLNKLEFMSIYDLHSQKFSKVLKYTKTLRKDGNALYLSKSYSQAIMKYRKAASILEDYSNVTEDEELLRYDCLAACYSNISVSYLKLGKGAQTCAACKNGLKYAKEKSDLIIKIYLRFANGLYLLGNYKEALSKLMNAKMEGAKGDEFNELKAKIIASRKEELAEEIKLCRRMTGQR